MKHFMIFMCSVAMLIFSSCSNNDSEFQSFQLKKETPEVLSGVLTPDNPVQMVKVGERYITLSLADSSQSIAGTRAIISNEEPKPKPGELGPFYAQGIPKEKVGKEFKNKKLLITKIFGVPTGVYFGDVWETSGVIQLPENAYIARVAFPNPSGCKDYNTLARGVNWNMVTTEGDKISVKWWFYTFVLTYNAAGMRISEVVPLDGKKVKIPYFYRTE